jgi:hypothetical protein
MVIALFKFLKKKEGSQIKKMGAILQYRIPLDFVGNGEAQKAYGGQLDAWSFIDINPEDWFKDFRDHVLDCIGKEYLPVYRMADGEYRFLMGRRYNFHKKPLLRELVAVTAEKLHIKNPNKWKTSWGENYAPGRVKDLKHNLIGDVRKIAGHGYLACYINDNGLNAFTEYNSILPHYFRKKNIQFHSKNYIPFHFVCNLFMAKGWQDFFENRNVLIVTGGNKNKNKIDNTLTRFGAKSVQYIPISETSSLEDNVDILNIQQPVDLCLVAAGIGSANIITQLQQLNTAVLDIGGFMHCFEDAGYSLHGDVFRLPA